MKLIDSPNYCEICGNPLEDYFWYCKTCEKFFCYDCLSKQLEHDIVALEYVTFGKSKLVPICGLGGGPSGDNWSTIPLDDLIHSSNLCVHALDSLKNKRVIFLCEGCNELICQDCLKYHEEHFPRHYVLLNDNKTLRMLYYDFYPVVNVSVTTYGPNSVREGEHVNLVVEIQNQSSKPLKDVNVSIISISKDEKIDPNSTSKDWYIELHYPSRVLLELNKNIGDLNPSEIKKVSFEVQIPKEKDIQLSINDPFVIYTELKFINFLTRPDSIYGTDLEMKLLK